MSKLAEIWRTISTDLGLKMVTPFQISLTDGTVIDADLLLKDFGGAKGMLLFDDYSKIEGYTDTLVEAGYGFSVLSRYPDDYKYDPEITKKMLADWTWTGSPDAKPEWLNDITTENQE